MEWGYDSPSAGRDCYETRAKVNTSHSIGQARVELSSGCQLPAAAPHLASSSHNFQEGSVVKIAKQVLGRHRAVHFADEQSPDILAAAVGEVPRMLTAIPEGKIGLMHEPDFNDVNAVRVHFLPELGVGAVREAKVVSLVAERSQLNGCQG